MAERASGPLRMTPVPPPAPAAPPPARPMPVVSANDGTGVSIGVDRFGFHVLIDGVPMFGPVPTRARADLVARVWRRRRR